MDNKYVDETINFGLVGCGAMGAEIAQAFKNKEIKGVLNAVYDLDTSRAESISRLLNNKPIICTKSSEIIDCCDFIIEAASQVAVETVVLESLNAGLDVLIMSAGALLDEDLRNRIYGLCEKNNCRLHIPSGAIAGIDGILSAKTAGIKEVTLTTTKPPKALAGTKYLIDKKIDLKKIKSAKTVFEGPANIAAKHFPKNINVSAILTLASGKMAKVKIVADPKTKNNKHEIKIKGKFGEIDVKIKNIPSPTNPKTSYLAILSAISTLKQAGEKIKIGN